jgi:hypothetical protein
MRQASQRSDGVNPVRYAIRLLVAGYPLALWMPQLAPSQGRNPGRFADIARSLDFDAASFDRA